MDGDDPSNVKSDQRSDPVSASDPSLAEMPVASIDDSHLAAAADEDLFSDPPLASKPPAVSSASGKAAKPRWSAVGAERGTVTGTLRA